MKKELIKLYKELLFTVPQTTPTLKTYAIVDSIRDEQVKEKILFSGLKHIDLWHEELFENELEVPLYLIELDKKNELLDYLLSQHTQSIATYFISPYSLETLQTYYSMFTYVNIEVEENNSNKGIFGFYDPNILSNYIQTLYNEEKVDEFFAGTALWLVPSVEKEDELYIAFRDKDGQIEDVNLQLSNLIEEETPMFDFNNISLPTLVNLEEYAHEVEIDYEQVQILDGFEKQKYLDEVFVRAKEDEYVFKNDEKTNREKANELFDEAKGLGVESEDGVYKYIIIALLANKPLKEFAFYGELGQVSNKDAKKEIVNETLWKTIQGRELDGR